MPFLFSVVLEVLAGLSHKTKEVGEGSGGGLKGKREERREWKEGKEGKGREGKKGIPAEKKVKLPICWWPVSLMENSKESTCVEEKKKKKKTLLELINKFSTVAAYKINTWRWVVFLYISNEQSEKETKTISLMIA